MSQPTDIATRLLKATRFAADRHRSQRRKGADAPPYINHPIGVADLVADVGGVTDLTTLVAAVLHDTVEETGTTLAEVEALFGAEVRALVAEVTDDKSLPKAERKRLQIEHAPNLSHHAKEIKIADKISNILEITHNPPADWPLERKREYLQWAERVVAGCRGANQGLDRRFDEVLRDARLSIGMTMTPRVGDFIYVDTELHLSHGIDDIHGGQCEVTKVTQGTAGGKPVHWLTLKEVPGLYKWEGYIESIQGDLRVKFGSVRARSTPDYRPEFNERVVEQIDETLLPPVSCSGTEPEGRLTLAAHLLHLYRLIQHMISSLDYVSNEIKSLSVTPEVRSHVEVVCGHFLETLTDAMAALEVLGEKLDTGAYAEIHTEARNAIKLMKSGLEGQIQSYHALVLSLRGSPPSGDNTALMLCQGLGIDIISGYRKVVDRIDSIAGALEG